MPQLARSEKIRRDRTAMVRHTLSQPMSLLVRYNLVREGVSVFDYGCGQGDDLRGLTAAGIEAAGWDPHFAPDAERRAADIVNLGFVLNVIEAPAEREATLRDAWRLARKTMSVASMVAGQVSTDSLRPYGDGFLTSRGTFQKYFHQAELRDLVRNTLAVDPVAVAPGIFLVFREPSDVEDFLLRRRMGRRVSTNAYRPPRRERAARARQPELKERIALALASIGNLVRLRGRTPHPEEIPAEALDELAHARVSIQRAIDCCLEEIVSSQEVETAAAAMREDLLIHYALGRLNRSQTSARPSAAIVRDIRAHFGSQRNAEDQAVEYLMSLSQPELVEQAIVEAAQAGLGARDQKQRLVMQGRNVSDLPGRLRLYLGCAAYLAGDPDNDWLVRIDPARKQVSYFPLEDALEPFPRTRETILIDMVRQTVSFLPIQRMLIAKSLVLKKGGRQQARLEDGYRETQGMSASVVLVRLNKQ